MLYLVSYFHISFYRFHIYCFYFTFFSYICSPRDIYNFQRLIGFHYNVPYIGFHDNIPCGKLSPGSAHWYFQNVFWRWATTFSQRPKVVFWTSCGFTLIKRTYLNIFDYDGNEIPVQVQKKEGDRVEHEMQEAEVLLLEVRVLRYLVILLMLL